MSPVLVNPSRFASPSAALAYSDEVLADSPLIYLKLQETSGTTATDDSGNSHAGTYAGTPALNQTTVMPSGTGSVQLNSTAKRVAVANGSWMNTSAFTAEAWIRLTTAGTSYQNIMNRDFTSANRGWNLYYTNGKLNAFVSASGNPSDHFGSTVLTAGNDYHCAMTSDGTTVRLYLNGVLDKTFTVGAGAVSTNDLMIGASIAGSFGGGTFNFSLNGNVDHAAYYGTALSATRIAAHYAAASVGP